MADDTTVEDFNNEQTEGGDSLVQPQSQDGNTPFSPPIDVVDDAGADIDVRTSGNTLDDTHQATDSATDIDAQQVYDEGLSGAAEAAETNAGNAVTAYNPEQAEDPTEDQAL